MTVAGDLCFRGLVAHETSRPDSLGVNRRPVTFPKNASSCGAVIFSFSAKSTSLPSDRVGLVIALETAVQDSREMVFSMIH